MERSELISAYAERIVEDMTFKDLLAFVTELLDEHFVEATDEEVADEIGNLYPDLVEDEGETDDSID